MFSASGEHEAGFKALIGIIGTYIKDFTLVLNSELIAGRCGGILVFLIVCEVVI
jgi:hypothetical protein